jgi:hypothetical protein
MKIGQLHDGLKPSAREPDFIDRVEERGVRMLCQERRRPGVQG